jgi:hypothetical protein
MSLIGFPVPMLVGVRLCPSTPSMSGSRQAIRL